MSASYSMPGASPHDSAEEFERSLSKDGTAGDQHFELKLYVAGTSPLSAQAVESVESFCREQLAGHCHLEVIDIHQQPAMIAEAQIVAAPTLVRLTPLPVRRLIGNLTSRERLVRGLNLAPKDTTSDSTAA